MQIVVQLMILNLDELAIMMIKEDELIKFRQRVELSTNISSQQSVSAQVND